MLRCYDKLILISRIISRTSKEALRNVGMRILQLSYREYQGTLYLPVLLRDKGEEALPSHCSTKQSSSSAGSTPADPEVLKLES